MEDGDNFQALSLDDRLAHKSAYEELGKAFRLAEPKDSIFKDRLEDMRKAPAEANAAALDAALTALHAYVEVSDSAARLRPLLLGVLIEKGLGAARATTKTKTIEILLEFVAVDAAEPVVAELGTFVTHKQPKLVAASINAITEVVRSFGANTAGVKSIVKFIPTIFQHADKGVRSEGSALVVELARWIGPAITVCYEGLKPVQVKELQDAVAKLPREAAHPLRWRRAEQAMASAAAVTATAAFDAAVAGESAVAAEMTAGAPTLATAIDAYAICDPVNVLDRIPEGFNENIESSKWKDRKDALDALLAVVRAPKIEDGHFGPLVNLLVKKVGDVNVSVAATAAQCLEALANGLRKSFSPHRGEVIPALLERCKEKNRAVVEALRSALDATIFCISSASELVETCGGAAFLKHKNPQVKAETLSWMGRAVSSVFKAQNAKREIKLLADAVSPCMDDSIADVRDAATATLAALIRVGTEKQVAPFLERLDKIKLAKVLELASGATAPAAAPTTGAEPAKSAPASQPAIAVNKPAAPSAPAMPSAAEAKPRAAAAPKAPSAVQKSLGTLSFARTAEEALEVMRQAAGEEAVEALSDANWKNRLAAVDAIAEKFQVVFPANVDSEVLVRCFASRPGWKESNFQVLGKVLSLLTLFAEKQSFTAEAASLAVPGLIEKISDPKLGTGVGLFLTAVAERTGLSFVFECLEEPIKLQKSPKALAEIFGWMASAVLDFGVKGLGINATVALTKIGIGNSNVAVRSAAMQVAVAFCRFTGPQAARSLYADLGGAQMSLLNSELAKVASEPAPVPIRHAKSGGGAVLESASADPNAMEVDNTPQLANVEDLLPRQDVTAALGGIASELSDAGWKVRKEAMDKALDIVRGAGNRIKLGNNDFLSELKERYNDSNKNLVVQALELSSAVAVALGPALERGGGLRTVLGPAAATLTDNKPQVRAAAIKFLTSALAVGSLASMASTLATSLATDSPNLRRELLTWLSENPQTIGRVSEEDRNLLLLATLNCLQDRTAEVRKAATGLVDACVDPLSGDVLLRHCQAVKPVLLPQIKQIVDAHVPRTAALANEQAHGGAAGAIPPKTPQKAAMAAGQIGASRTPRKGGEAAEPVGKVFIATDPQIKGARLEAESKGPLKWAFDAPRAEFCDHLRGWMQGCLSSVVVRQLFSDDFKEAINGMTLVDGAVLNAQEKEGVICNVDLVLKYLTIRLFDTNTTVLIKTFDVIEHLLGLVDEANLRLSEVEAGAFLPQFVQRAGEMKEPIKGRLRGIYRQLCRVYPASKIFVFLLEGLKSKSARARVECLNEMEVLITRNGLMVVQAAKHVPVIASVISDRDSHVRNAALNVLVQLHELLGETLYKHMAGLSQKDLDLFSERLRRFKDKSLPQEVEMETEMEMEIDEAQDETKESQGGEPAQPTEEVPRVFALDPMQYGSPVRQTRVSIAGTPYMAHSNVAPTPALPIMTMSSSLYQPPSLDDPLDRAIQLIGSSTDLECISALQRLDEFMATPISLLPKISPLVGALVVRLHECTNSMMDVDVALKSRLCRYVTNALVLVCTDRMLIQQVDVPTLTLLVRETLACLVNGQVGQFEDRDQVGRALNVLLVKCLENGNRNSCYRCLLALLEQAFRVPPSAEDKYPEFVMKCMWKLTKQLSGALQAGEVKIGKLLTDIHHFFCSLPPMEWKTRAAQKMPMEDLPLRTVKTILHELATTLGDRIIPAVREMENAEQSFVTSYLRAMLAANNVDVSGLDFGRYPAPAQPAVAAPTPTVSFEELEDALKDICSKICSKPNTRAGLAELYELQKQHPHASEFIDAYLEKLGNFFYKYIKRNLAHIEAEMGRSAGDSNTAGGTPIESYKTKLAQIQSQLTMGRGGMVGETATDTDVVMASPVRNRLDSPAAKGSPRTPVRVAAAEGTPPTKDSTIMSLKERLARLRQGGEL